MTTRPTYEEIRAMIIWNRTQAFACGISEQHQDEGEMHDRCAYALEAWIAERQVARGEVTDEREMFDNWFRDSNWSGDGDMRIAQAAWDARAALQSIAQPVSVPNAYELWAAAQLVPGEGIEDGARRIEAILSASPQPQQAVPDVVYVCSNRDCMAVHEIDPRGHCPTCKQENGSGWSTMQRKFYASQKAK